MSISSNIHSESTSPSFFSKSSFRSSLGKSPSPKKKSFKKAKKAVKNCLSFFYGKTFQKIEGNVAIVNIAKSVFKVSIAAVKMSSDKVKSSLVNTKIGGINVEQCIEIVNLFIFVTMPLTIVNFIKNCITFHELRDIGYEIDLTYAAEELLRSIDSLISGVMTVAYSFEKFGAWALESIGDVFNSISQFTIVFSIISLVAEVYSVVENKRLLKLLKFKENNSLEELENKFESLQSRIEKDKKFAEKRTGRIDKKLKKLEKKQSKLTQKKKISKERRLKKSKKIEENIFVLNKEKSRLGKFEDLLLRCGSLKENLSEDSIESSKLELKKIVVGSLNLKTDKYLERQALGGESFGLSSKDYIKLEILRKKEVENSAVEKDELDIEFINRLKKKVLKELRTRNAIIDKGNSFANFLKKFGTVGAFKKVAEVNKVKARNDRIITKILDPNQESTVNRLMKWSDFEKKKGLEEVRKKVSNVFDRVIVKEGKKANKIAKEEKLIAEEVDAEVNYLKAKISSKISSRYVTLVARTIGILAGIVFMISAIPAGVGYVLLAVMLVIYLSRMIKSRNQGKRDIHSVLNDEGKKGKRYAGPTSVNLAKTLDGGGNSGDDADGSVDV